MFNRRDVIYLYDGTFDGFLTAVFECYYNHELPLNIEVTENGQQSILTEYKHIYTDIEKAQRVALSFPKKISPRAFSNIFYTFLSTVQNKEILLLNYIRAGYKFGKLTDNHLTIDCVNKVLKARENVGGEAHLYTGFVRFSELEGGIYYAEIEPKNNVLPIIARHFVERYTNMPFLIHDTNRHECLVYNGKECTIHKTDSLPKINLSEKEKNYRKMWTEFYNTIEIKERHNEKCRMSHMPKRFWRKMTEFNII